MKNIHDILAAYELAIPEDKKPEFDKAVADNYRTVNDYDKQGEKLKLAEGKVKTTEEALKAFEGVDVDGLQGEITKLKGDLAQRDTDYAAKIADMAFDAIFGTAVSTLRGKSANAIRGELGQEALDALKGSKNQEADIKAALEALKGNADYLFETAPKRP